MSNAFETAKQIARCIEHENNHFNYLSNLDLKTPSKNLEYVTCNYCKNPNKLKHESCSTCGAY